FLEPLQLLPHASLFRPLRHRLQLRLQVLDLLIAADRVLIVGECRLIVHHWRSASTRTTRATSRRPASSARGRRRDRHARHHAQHERRELIEELRAGKGFEAAPDQLPLREAPEALLLATRLGDRGALVLRRRHDVADAAEHTAHYPKASANSCTAS